MHPVNCFLYSIAKSDLFHNTPVSSISQNISQVKENLKINEIFIYKNWKKFFIDFFRQNAKINEAKFAQNSETKNTPKESRCFATLFIILIQ